jgi:hypothetical protein
MSKILTIEQAKQISNPIELVKYFNPDWTDEECDYFLWEFTCFPFSLEETVKQLNERFSLPDEQPE